MLKGIRLPPYKRLFTKIEDVFFFFDVKQKLSTSKQEIKQLQVLCPDRRVEPCRT
jgi:hypothetical protein